MKRLPAILAVLLCLLSFALADEQTCILDLDNLSPAVSTDCSYLSATCTLEDAAPVSIAVYDNQDNLVYQRNYGQCMGSFRSEEVYLRLNGGDSVYRLRADVGGSVRETLVTRKQPRLENNIACSSGYPLSMLTGRESRCSVTLLDTAALAEAPVTVPLQSSGMFDLGTVTFSLQDGCLLAEALLHEDLRAEVNDDQVCVAATSIGAENLDSTRFTGIRSTLDTPIDLQGAPYVAVFVRLTVSFNPSGSRLHPVVELEGQQELWEQLQLQTESNAVG